MITLPLEMSAATEINQSNELVCAEKWQLFAGIAQKGLTMTIGPSALFCTAASIRSLPPDVEDDTAAEYARNTAISLLEGCAIATPCSLSPISIEQFEHDLLLRWQLKEKGLLLTCPGEPGVGPSLYRERVENGHSVQPEIVSNATIEDLALSMKWMLFPE